MMENDDKPSKKCCYYVVILNFQIDSTVLQRSRKIRPHLLNVNFRWMESCHMTFEAVRIPGMHIFFSFYSLGRPPNCGKYLEHLENKSWIPARKPLNNLKHPQKAWWKNSWEITSLGPWNGCVPYWDEIRLILKAALEDPEKKYENMSLYGGVLKSLVPPNHPKFELWLGDPHDWRETSSWRMYEYNVIHPINQPPNQQYYGWYTQSPKNGFMAFKAFALPHSWLLMYILISLCALLPNHYNYDYFWILMISNGYHNRYCNGYCSFYIPWIYQWIRIYHHGTLQ